MLQRSSRFAAAIGVCVAAAGFALEFLPSSRPGLNEVQLLVVLTGLSLVLLAVALRLFQRRKAWRSLRSALARALVVAVLTLLALELALVAIGYATYFPQYVPDEFLRPAPWWTCEDPACHYVQDEMAKACESGSMSGRFCAVNAQGFHDSQDFVYRPALENQTRILALGDSFTFGEDADIGKSYVDSLEAGGPRRVVWNTGIFGVGTNQAVAAFEMFAPVLKPHLTIYGFYVNDFFDNLFPVDGYFLGIDENGDVVKLQRYHLDPWGNVSELETQSLLYYRWRGVEAPANEFERLLGSTRLGSVFIGAIDQLGKQLGIAQKTHFGRQVALTRGYLQALRDASAAQDSELLIMLIPRKTDLRQPGTEFQQAVKLFEEFGISYIMPIEILDAKDDYAADWHWNNRGHQKVGVLLSDCVDKFVVKGNLDDCRHVVSS